jgi:hypothetical protein
VRCVLDKNEITDWDKAARYAAIELSVDMASRAQLLAKASVALFVTTRVKSHTAPEATTDLNR